MDWFFRDHCTLLATPDRSRNHIRVTSGSFPGTLPGHSRATPGPLQACEQKSSFCSFLSKIIREWIFWFEINFSEWNLFLDTFSIPAKIAAKRYSCKTIRGRGKNTKFPKRHLLWNSLTKQLRQLSDWMCRKRKWTSEMLNLCKWWWWGGGCKDGADVTFQNNFLF